MNKFIVNRQLPSLNNVIAKNRANKYLGAKFKADIEESIGWDIKQALTKGELKKITEPCEIYITWNEKTKRRDVDNIQSSQKFILDALVKCGVLVNDNRRYVKQIHHKVIEAERDFVEVCILETPKEIGKEKAV